MSKLLLNLRNVPDDEAADVRAFLDANRIAWYETRPGPFGISMGGIWVKHDQDVPEAKRLMADYQAGRRTRVRAEHEAARREGREETFAMLLRERPGWVLLRVAGILLLLALMALPGYLLWR
ncbi:hypothetical protein H0E84_13365 [Luteimonas sp. SJ-92]|uniref:DUF2007 domain-containing protein n=1 Tax=Luteimonas salinisoli TaxID=2752307 RepID=A0A853JEU4_9GAMM|nr:DUF6164 family protein [Luteimonas salinisoli]NZA27375.1 hypothetical protein [Luteimonas salinisoli]